MKNFHSIKILIVLGLFICELTCIGQTMKFQTIVMDEFNGNQNGWAVVSNTENTPYETYLTRDNRYLFNLPPSSPWGFTWVPIPTFFRQIDQFENAEITFNLQILDMPNGNFRVGFLFDKHNVTDDCIGGDFYNLTFEGTGDKIYSTIRQRKNCSYSEVKNPIVSSSGSASLSPDNNRIRIRKSNERYDVFINDVSVLSFDYKGDLDFSNLYFGKGRFTIDDLAINSIEFESQVITQNIPLNRNSSIYIVLAGINVYDDEKYKQPLLNFAVADVESMYEFWTSPSGGRINPKNIVLLKDSEAKTENILSAAYELFSKASENDVIVTFFSGHGGNGIFCAYDGGLQYERLNQIINESKAKNKLFIVDACRAGSWDVNNVLVPRGQRLSEQDALNLFYERLTNAGSGINFLLASEPNEYSADDPEFGHGAFTHYVLEGLKGDADKVNNEDNIVTLSELDSFLKVKFEEWNRKNHGTYYRDGTPIRQTPTLKGGGDLNMPLAVRLNGN